MTVGELIAEFQKHEPTLPVCYWTEDHLDYPEEVVKLERRKAFFMRHLSGQRYEPTDDHEAVVLS